MNARKFWAVAFGVCCMLLAALACEANAVNMKVDGTPKYVCPSSTPRPTNTPLLPDPPRYTSWFQANLNYTFVDPSRDFVYVQYLVQSAGWVKIAYSGIYNTGFVWTGTNGYINVAYSGTNSMGFASLYGVFIPPEVSSAQIWISTDFAGGMSFSVARIASSFFITPNTMPCCLPAPISPTPRPTYTPYPTPTLYAIPPYNNGAYFLDDPVYNYQPPVQLRLRMKSPIKSGSFIIPFFGIGWTAASWTLEITNVGSKEYDFLGAGYTYISEVNDGGTIKTGVWSPAHNAAEFLGVTEQAYGPKAVMPGQTITVTVAAWIPVSSSVTKVSLVLDPYNAGDPGWATFTPGQERIATWINQVNTICRGEIKYP